MPEPRRAAPARRGFALNCLMCGHADSVTVNLGDVLNFTCAECEADYGIDYVRQALSAWDAALAWLLTAPAIEE
jgi:transcription elongation factor Elf1